LDFVCNLVFPFVLEIDLIFKYRCNKPRKTFRNQNDRQKFVSDGFAYLRVVRHIMKSFYDKEDYTFEDLASLIQNEVEESIYLDYKEAHALEKNDAKRKDVSKDVASFANCEGGIIIYGIKELNHKAHSFSFIDGNEFTKEWLEQIINSTIQRRISDLLIFPVRKEGLITQTIYLVKIPKSLEGPHLSKDKRFYKRFNFESVQMEEYEIRQLYGRKVKSKLELGYWGIGLKNPDPDDDQDLINFKIEVGVSNVGDVVESFYKVNFYFNNLHPSVNISYPQNLSNYDYTKLDGSKVKISSFGVVPVYPNETVNVLRFNVSVPYSKLEEAFRDEKLDIKLYYLNGEHEGEMMINDTLDKIIADRNAS
jgi:hypothetical protein